VVALTQGTRADVEDQLSAAVFWLNRTKYYQGRAEQEE
jgi:hypothetical protein